MSVLPPGPIRGEPEPSGKARLLAGIKRNWCSRFHRRHRELAGVRRVYSLSVAYVYRCRKCGQEHLEAG